jgi:hypothetical protein
MAATYPAGVKTFTTKVDGVDDILAEHINSPQEEIVAIETDLLGDRAAGWVSAGETWTYASATSFTISGDKTGKYQKGDKIKLTQTTVKYFYITAVSYGAPNTTVTVTGGNDYTVASAAISANYYSKVEIPFGFPDWFNWSPTLTGWGTPPSAIYRFRIAGRKVSVAVRQYGSPVSNGTTLVITAPVASANINANMFWGGAVWDARDGGSYLTTAARVLIGNNTSNMQAYTNMSSGTWTNSGAKQVGFSLDYEF